MTASHPTVDPGADQAGTSPLTDDALDQQGRRRSSGGFREDRPARKSNTLTAVMLVVCLGYFLFPLYWLVIASTKSNADLFSTFGLWFADFSLIDNLRQVFTVQNGVFGRWALNSVFYSVVSAVGGTLLATAAGYAFAKYEFPGGKALFSIILGAIMIPTTALAIPTYLLFARAELTDTAWAIILPSLVSPFGVYLMRVYAADAVDTSMIEAARVDGVGEIRIFLQVGLRLLVPGSVTVLLFGLVATWNNYFLPLIMLNSPEKFPLPVGLAQWQSTASAGSGAQAMFSTVITGSLVSIIPLVIAFLFLQRYWQSGLATGGVKA
jgi:multiple sugar transport system permease protein